MEETKTGKRKSKRKKRLSVITDRDMDIFRMLSSGPAVFIQIRLFMERIYRQKMTASALWARLSKLKASGHIQSRRYAGRETHGMFSLYSLTPLSIELLVNAGYPPGGIRAMLPDDSMVAHDMLVTDIVRTIKRDGVGLYEYQLTDKNTLKQALNKSGDYPDLHLRLSFDPKKNHNVKIYGIEVDLGAALPAGIVGKVKQLPNHTLILCRTAGRVESLKRAFAANENQTWSDKVYFGELPDFIRNGLIGANWVNTKGERKYLL